MAYISHLVWVCSQWADKIRAVSGRKEDNPPVRVLANESKSVFQVEIKFDLDDIQAWHETLVCYDKNKLIEIMELITQRLAALYYETLNRRSVH